MSDAKSNVSNEKCPTFYKEKLKNPKKTSSLLSMIKALFSVSKGK